MAEVLLVREYHLRWLPVANEMDRLHLSLLYSAS